MLGPLALDDLRILDLSQGIAGPLTARLIGDYGGDVIKVEPLDGDDSRRMPPFFSLRLAPYLRSPLINRFIAANCARI